MSDRLPCCSAAVELGSTTGIRVLNVAGVGQSGWDIIEDSINEDNRSMVWTLDTTEGKATPPPLLYASACVID